MENLEQRVTNIESALRSQGISIPDCNQLREDVLVEPESRDDGAIVVDGEPVVGLSMAPPPTEAEVRAHLETLLMDDLRAQANDLPIENMHDLDKAALIDAMLVCWFGGVGEVTTEAPALRALRTEEPNGEA